MQFAPVGNLRSLQKDLYVVPVVKTLRVFSMMPPPPSLRLWNSIPHCVRQANSVRNSKLLLKHIYLVD